MHITRRNLLLGAGASALAAPGLAGLTTINYTEERIRLAEACIRWKFRTPEKNT